MFFIKRKFPDPIWNERKMGLEQIRASVMKELKCSPPDVERRVKASFGRKEEMVPKPAEGHNSRLAY